MGRNEDKTATCKARREASSLSQPPGLRESVSAAGAAQPAARGFVLAA